MQIKRVQIHNGNLIELQQLLDGGWRQWAPPFVGQFGECVYLCKEDDAQAIAEATGTTPRRRAPKGELAMETK